MSKKITTLFFLFTVYSYNLTYVPTVYTDESLIQYIQDPSRMWAEQFEAKVKFNKATLREKLSDIQYRVTQEAEMEYPESGEFYKHFETGIYSCIICEMPLFCSRHKMRSNLGYATFNDTWGEIVEIKFKSLVIMSVETKCRNCGSHIGDVFNYLIPPLKPYKTYWANSAALKFQATTEEEIEDLPELKVQIEQ